MRRTERIVQWADQARASVYSAKVADKMLRAVLS